MEPTDPTTESLESLASHGQPEIRRQLLRTAAEVASLVPTVTGLSITKMDAGVPLTLVATSPSILPLEAIQYLDGGPLVDAVYNGSRVLAEDNDPLSESEWSTFARASAAHGVRASLSLPLVEHGRVVGTVNVYASTSDAFDLRAETIPEIAEIVGAWAPGAVRDSDLTFSSRLAAIETSVELERRGRLVEQAVGVIGRLKGLDQDSALRSLRECAARAGVADTEVARTIMVFHEP